MDTATKTESCSLTYTQTQVRPEITYLTSCAMAGTCHPTATRLGAQEGEEPESAGVFQFP